MQGWLVGWSIGKLAGLLAGATWLCYRQETSLAQCSPTSSLTFISCKLGGASWVNWFQPFQFSLIVSNTKAEQNQMKSSFIPRDSDIGI